tara:strand:- start:10841 stop:10942 length:102 start_codon:yes stop_codon:yes gene_type:complete
MKIESLPYKKGNEAGIKQKQKKRAVSDETALNK